MNRREFLISTAIASATVAVPFVPPIVDEPKDEWITVSLNSPYPDGRVWVTARAPGGKVLLRAPYHYEEHKHLAGYCSGEWEAVTLDCDALDGINWDAT